MISRIAAPQILLGAAAGICVWLMVGAPQAGGSAWALVLMAVIAFLAGRAHARPAGALTLALLLAGVAASQVIAYSNDAIVPEIMLPVTLYVAGLALRGREALADRLAQQGEELESERDAYAHLSVRYERARIAAELHDVVAHAISVMVVQASAGQRIAVREPARVAEAFDVIATAGRHAQADLDRLADLLGQDTAPNQSTDLGLVREVVDTARASGLPIRLRVSGETSEVSSAAAHVALRVVQEGLTNALRYAPGASVEVAMRVCPGALELAVLNGRSTAPAQLRLGSGHGLTGLRERVGACGGKLDAGPNGEGGWSLSASIDC